MAPKRVEFPAHVTGIAVVAAVIFGLTIQRVVAQCALCGSATPYAGSDPAQTFRTFLAAALVLLVPVGGIVAALGAYMRKHRD